MRPIVSSSCEPNTKRSNAAFSTSAVRHCSAPGNSDISIDQKFIFLFYPVTVPTIIYKSLSGNMILAYRWARKKHQQRQQARHDEALGSPPANTVELPRQAHVEATVQHGTSKEASQSLEPPANAAVQNGIPATKSAKAVAKTEKPEATPEEKAEQRRKRAYRWKIVIGLFAPFTLQSLDTTIIASALPFIASDFSEHFYPPTFRAFLLSIKNQQTDMNSSLPLQTSFPSSTGSYPYSTSPQPRSCPSGPK